MMPLEDLFRVSGHLLDPDGRIVIIYPAAGADHIRKSMNLAGFGPSRMLCIHPHEGTGPGLMCVEAKPGHTRETHTEAPLFLYDGSGRRTPRAEAVLAGEGTDDHVISERQDLR